MCWRDRHGGGVPRSAALRNFAFGHPDGAFVQAGIVISGWPGAARNPEDYAKSGCREYGAKRSTPASHHALIPNSFGDHIVNKGLSARALEGRSLCRQSGAGTVQYLWCTFAASLRRTFISADFESGPGDWPALSRSKCCRLCFVRALSPAR